MWLVDAILRLRKSKENMVIIRSVVYPLNLGDFHIHISSRCFVQFYRVIVSEAIYLLPKVLFIYFSISLLTPINTSVGKHLFNANNRHYSTIFPCGTHVN